MPIVMISGDIIGALCKQLGPQVYENCKEIITNLIGAELRCVFNSGDEFNHMDSRDFKMETDQEETFTKAKSTNSAVIQHPHNNYSSHDSSLPSFERITVFEASPKGVRSSNLETVLKCLINIVNALGPQFACYVSQNFLEMVLNSLQHPNRFVREVGFSLCVALLDAGKKVD